MFWPCETRTSICRNLATISSGLYRFLAITVLLDVKDIPQVGPLQWGWITDACEKLDHLEDSIDIARTANVDILYWLIITACEQQFNLTEALYKRRKELAARQFYVTEQS